MQRETMPAATRAPEGPEASVQAAAAGLDRAFDFGDIDAYLEACTPGTILVTPFGRIEGREPMRRFLWEFFRDASEQRFRTAERHVAVDGREAHVRGEFRTGPQGAEPIEPSGTFADVYDFVEGAWKLRHRRLEVHGQAWLALESGQRGVSLASQRW